MLACKECGSEEMKWFEVAVFDSEEWIEKSSVIFCLGCYEEYEIKSAT